MECDGHCLYEVQLVEGIKEWVLIFQDCTEGCTCEETLLYPDTEYYEVGQQIDGPCSKIVTPKE